MVSNPVQFAYDGLIKRGFSPTQSAILAGNIQQESSGNPVAWNAKEGAGGLLQWRGDRLTGLENYAVATKRSPSDPDTQLDFIVHEMQGPEGKNAAAFLGSTDPTSANAALKQYVRYGDNSMGTRLNYARPYLVADSGMKQYDASGQPITAKPAPAPSVQPAAAPAATVAPAAASPSDDELLTKYLAPPPSANPADPVVADRAQQLAATQPPSPDDALLTKYLGVGAPQTGAGDQSNPMSVNKGNRATTPASYTPSAVPWMDQANAFANSAVNAIPVIGPGLTDIGNKVDAGFNNLLGFPTQTPQDRAAINAGEQAQFPAASTAGSIAGTVAPLAIAGSTALGGRLLGTTGNLLTRAGFGAASGGALSGADTLMRGGSLEDARNNALLGAGIGAAAPVMFGGNMLQRTLGGAGMGAVVGGGSTLVNGGTLEDAGNNALKGAAVGAGVGAGAGYANKLISGGGVAPEVAQLAQIAQDKFGIPLRAGQISTNPLVNRADALVGKLPMSGGTASYEAQTGAFTKAIAKEMGESASSLSPQVMQAAKTRIGAAFDSVATRTPVIPADAQFDQDVMSAMTNAQHTLTSDQMGPVNKQFDDLMGKFQQGGNRISGETYQAMTRRGSPLDAAMNSKDPSIAQAASQLKDALDGAMQRAAPADAAADLQQARYQWKVMRTVEDMAEKAPTGGVSPALLMGAVRKNFPNMAYDGGGNMGDLARIGQQFLKPPTSSGTAENLGVMKGAGQAIGLGGGSLGLWQLIQHPELLAPAGLAAAGLGMGSAALGAIVRSKALANKLIQSGLVTAPKGPSMGNLLMRSSEPAAQNMLLPPGPGGDHGPLRITVHGATILPPGSIDPGRPFAQ